MNNDNKPPSHIQFSNIQMRNYTLIWSGLIHSQNFKEVPESILNWAGF